MTGPVATTAAIAQRLAACYADVPADAVVSSGHAFLCRTYASDPEAHARLDERVARTLRSLADHEPLAVEPRVWMTQEDGLLVRLDGFGPVVAMDADATRLAIVETLRGTVPTRDEHMTIVASLRAAASTLPPFATDVSCSAPMAWRPACIELDPVLVPDVNWWSGTRDFARRSSPDTLERSLLDADLARLLPRFACATEASVTVDDRIGLLLRPVSWAIDAHQQMGSMETMRTFTALADMLARHPRTHTETGR